MLLSASRFAERFPPRGELRERIVVHRLGGRLDGYFQLPSGEREALGDGERRRAAESLHDADLLAEPEEVEARVHLPPPEALRGRARVIVVGVVPALTHGQQSE